MRCRSALIRLAHQKKKPQMFFIFFASLPTDHLTYLRIYLCQPRYALEGALRSSFPRLLCFHGYGHSELNISTAFAIF